MKPMAILMCVQNAAEQLYLPNKSRRRCNICSKKRFWLTSFLLILRIAFAIIGALIYFGMPALMIESNPKHNQATIFVSGFLCLIDAAGIFLLLRWEKTGFWLSAASLMYCISGTLILFGILQIPKDGSSAWKKLENGIF